MESEYNLYAYEKNQVRIFSVAGEADSRTVKFNIVEKTGTVAATSNAEPTDLMLDLTGCTVYFKIIETRVRTLGTIISATDGIVRFTLPEEFMDVEGSYQCEVDVTKNDQILKIIGITLTVAYPDSQEDAGLSNSSNITLNVPQGTTYYGSIRLTDRVYDSSGRLISETPHAATEGEKLIIAVKKHLSDEEYIIKKILDTTTGSTDAVPFIFNATDTAIPRGKYKYDIGVKLSDGSFHIPVRDSVLVITTAYSALAEVAENE